MTVQEKKVQKLEKIISLLNEGLTKKDFATAFEKVVDYIKNIEKKNDVEIKIIKTLVDSFLKDLRKEYEFNLKETRGNVENIIALVANEIKKISEQHEAKMDFVEDRMAEVESEKIVEQVLAKIPPIEIPPIPKIIPETPEETRDKLESLEGEERLDKSAIKGLEEIYEAIKVGKKGVQLIGGARGIQLYINGTKKGLVQALNLIPGTNMTITYLAAFGRNDITFDASGGGISVETPTGTVNGSNVTFTVSNAPSYIVVDGVSKFETLHYTYAAGTITITDGAPPVQYIRSFYS